MADAFLSSVGKELDDRGSRSNYRSSRDDDRYHSRRRSRSPYRDDRRRDRYDERPRYDDRDRGGRYDDRRGPPPGRFDDRRGGPPRDGYRGGGGGGKRGARGENGVFGSPNIRRSPTPEGTIPISKRSRKYTAWDVKAPGYESMNAMEAKISGAFMLPGQTRPMQPPMGGGFGMPPMSRDGGFGMPGSLPPIHFRPAQGQAGPVAATQSFARQARRLYVGNILETADEKNISDFFNAKMIEMGLLTKQEETMGQMVSEHPVVAVQVNHEKNYAFVEFRNSEEASHAMSFDGIVFQGQSVKIRRPKDYTGSDFTGSGHIPGVVSTNVPDSPNKIFVGGLPSYLTDDQVIELLKSFGELKSFNLVKDGAGTTSKGFAFCEYVDPDVTDVACQGLNGMELGDRYLVVQRAQIGQNPGGPAPTGMPGTGYAGYGGQSAAANVLAAVEGGEAEKTRVLQLYNMVVPEELVDDTEYSEIVEDVKEECGKYGTVEDVRIPRPIRTEKGRMDVRASESVKDLGKVFVLFSAVTEATAALQAIAGRSFGGRVVICAFAPEEVML